MAKKKINSSNMLDLIRNVKSCEQAIKQLTAEKEAAQQEIKQAMNDNGLTEYCVDIFTCKLTTVNTCRFDSKSFEKLYKDLYNKFSKITESVRFTIT